MEQVRRALQTIQSSLERLTVSQKLLMASLVVVMLMTLFVVSQYAGGREMVELMPGGSTAQQQRAVEFLRGSGIDHRVEDGRALVPVERKHFVLAQMSQGGALPDDTSLLFSNVVDRQSWATPAEQRRQMGLYALQNELATVISQFPSVRTAKVIIDDPPVSGLGQATRRPTASATVFSTDGGALTQNAVDAIAHLVAGARSGLSVEQVRVIDGSTNRQRRARGEDQAFSGAYMEHAANVEKRVREKLLDMLAYVEGVIVQVNAQVDLRRTSLEEERILPPGEGSLTVPTREFSSEETEQARASGGEAGARSNTGLNIARGGGGGPSFNRSESEAELQTEFGRRVERVVDPRGNPTKINATVNIPRSYFARRWRQSAGEQDAEPTDEDLAPIIESELARIRGDVEPQVDTSAAGDGEVGSVVVSMIPDWAPAKAASQAGVGGMFSPGGALGSGWIKTVGLAALAAASLGLMALSLKKASKRVELPSAEELAGVPPALQTDLSMVGEADEADAALAGVELSDEELERRKRLEQVTRMVKEQPKDAALIVSRWINADD